MGCLKTHIEWEPNLRLVYSNWASNMFQGGGGASSGGGSSSGNNGGITNGFAAIVGLHSGANGNIISNGSYEAIGNGFLSDGTNFVDLFDGEVYDLNPVDIGVVKNRFTGFSDEQTEAIYESVINGNHETSLISALVKREPAEGFWGVAKYMWDGGVYDGYNYDLAGNRMGMAPTSFVVSGLLSGPAGKGSSAIKLGKKLRQMIRRGKSPKGVTRVDIPKLDPSGRVLHGQKVHLHLKDGRALNLDGTWKHGSGTISNTILNWIKNFID